MKKIYSLVLCVIAFLAVSCVGINIVKADEATLSALKVQAKDEDGKTAAVQLSPKFSADVTEYNVTVMNNVKELVVDATTTEDSATYKVEWALLDVGDNKTYVYVKAADGTKKTYILLTKRLTEDEEATYEAPENSDDEDADSEGDDSDDNDSEGSKSKVSKNAVKVDVNGITMAIASKFKSSDIPEGFNKTKFEYQGKTFASITGVAKNVTAVWLVPVDGENETSQDAEEVTEESTEETTEESADATEIKYEEGFYIYEEENDRFYPMNNIYIKSRMYTIVDMYTPDSVLSGYDQTTVDMCGENVKAWVLNEEDKLYLVYAMNWNGETSLYCYDDVEKCFQRYIIDTAAANLVEAQREKVNNLQLKNNELVQKLNDSNSTKWKIIGGLAVAVVILFFICLNLLLALKTKKVLEEDDDYEDDYVDKKEIARAKKEAKKESKRQAKEEKAEQNQNRKNEKKDSKKYDFIADDDDDVELVIDDDDDDDELFKLVEDDDDFVIMESKTTKLPEFELGKDEIDLSGQVMKEMSTAPEEEEKFSDESVKEILNTAFPDNDNDDEDDDGFTFI